MIFLLQNSTSTIKKQMKGLDKMKKLVLLSLTLTNFKGVKDFTINTGGLNAEVYGRNGLGKTTIFDAFSWLLFGKDSHNKTDFEIKTLDADGNVMHGLDHSVEATFSLNDEEFSLKRLYKENWKKKRGTTHSTLSGHTTKYFIDGVSSTKKEYEGKVDSIISEDIFKLITNPLYFNTKMKWKDRRDILVDIAGGVTYEEVAKGHNDLEEFVKELNGKDIEKKKKEVKAKQKEINDELESIPFRIDEINRSLPDIRGLKASAVKEQLEIIDQKLMEKQAEINDIRSGGEVANKRKKAMEIAMEMTNIRSNHESGEKEKLYKVKAKIQEEESNVQILEHKIKGSEATIDTNQKRKASLENEVQELRGRWSEVNSQEFEHDGECTCPTCGQDLPESQIEEARSNAETKFNEEKSQELERIMSAAKEKKQEIEQLEVDTEKLQNDIDKLHKEVKKKEQKVDSLKEDAKELELNVSDVTDNPLYIEKLKEKESVEKEIIELKESTQGAVLKVQGDITELEAERKTIQDKLNDLSMHEKAQTRLNELKEKEKNLSAEYEKLAHQEHMIETLTKKQMNCLEEKINSKFELAKFKLFETQLNGGSNEVCETLYEGVPFDSNLNTASRINVGLDIINVLSDHYGVFAPIFIDNRESVTDLIETKSQVMSLIVSKSHDVLTIEVEEQIA